MMNKNQNSKIPFFTLTREDVTHIVTIQKIDFKRRNAREGVIYIHALHNGRNMHFDCHVNAQLIAVGDWEEIRAEQEPRTLYLAILYEHNISNRLISIVYGIQSLFNKFPL